MMRIDVVCQRPSQTTFGQKPNAKEMQLYKKTIVEGLNVLEKKLGIIIHNPSVPAIKKENTGIGSLISRTTENYFLPFLKLHNFSSIQQEPDNLRRLIGDSPYSPLTPSKNIFMIPLERLNTSEYANILPTAILQKSYLKNVSEDIQKVDYPIVKKSYDFLLKKAYINFLKKVENVNKLPKDKKSELLALKSEFEKYKKVNGEEQTNYAIYEILSKLYKDDNWRNWNHIDKTLFNSKDCVQKDL